VLKKRALPLTRCGRLHILRQAGGAAARLRAFSNHNRPSAA